MKQIEGVPGASAAPVVASPTKHLEFRRGNSRVVADGAMSPRSGFARRRGLLTPQKYRAAQQQARKPSNPIGRPGSRLDDETPRLAPPSLQPPQPSLKPAGDDDEWQDIDQPLPAVGQSAGGQLAGEQPVNGRVSPSAAGRSAGSSASTRAEPAKTGSPPTQRPFVLPQPRLDRSVQDASRTTAKLPSDDDGASSTSFLGFSPSATGASLLKKLSRRSSHLKRNLRARWSDESSDDAHTPREKKPWHASPTAQTSPKSTARPFWLDPSTPALLAMYLQVGFNLLMVSALLYGIAVFYTTIRNDVNMKVEEYSVDIVAEMAHCSQEYLRNNCDPSRRVPALEIPCREWERCMERDPRQVGRAKVSAETFGSIVEAFLRPIGIKSMVFLVCVFAGSFLLVNAVFASRIGPRFSAQYQHNPYDIPQPPSGATRPNSAQSYQQPQQMPPPPQQVQYHPSPYMPFTPSRGHASPLARQTPIHATLQSSPLQAHHLPPYYPY